LISAALNSSLAASHLHYFAQLSFDATISQMRGCQEVLCGLVIVRLLDFMFQPLVMS